MTSGSSSGAGTTGTGPESRPEPPTLPAETAAAPSCGWMACSTATMMAVGWLCKAFLTGVSTLELEGHERFFDLLRSRADPEARTRGLITVSNHISVMDDPIIWGTLPLRDNKILAPFNRRWAFGSHDICFSNRFFSAFFTFGQVLPTHRGLHSTRAGIFQPTVTQAIRLLSRGPFAPEPHKAPSALQRWSIDNVCVDPFSDVETGFTTTGDDSNIAPSAYASNSHAWIHIFPEGKVHQTEKKTMRYFKWGVSRLILEASDCPDVVPMWIEGTDEVMNEARGFPRFLPRPGRRVSVTFGAPVDVEAAFGDMRARWRRLVERADRHRTRAAASSSSSSPPLPPPFGVIEDEELRHGAEAVALRIECTRKVRNLVLEVRRTRGLEEEDPREALVDTWARDKVEKLEAKTDGQPF